MSVIAVKILSSLTLPATIISFTRTSAVAVSGKAIDFAISHLIQFSVTHRAGINLCRNSINQNFKNSLSYITLLQSNCQLLTSLQLQRQSRILGTLLKAHPNLIFSACISN